MLNARLVRRVRIALLTTFAAGSTMFASCGMADIRDNLIAGSLAGFKGAATNWVGGFLINFNEFWEPFPDNPIDTP